MTEIVEITAQYKNVPGVYFLYDKGRLQYVGQSKDCGRRVRAHKHFYFDEVRVLPCPSERERDDFEGFCIRIFRPPENKTRHRADFAAPQSQLWDGVIAGRVWIDGLRWFDEGEIVPDFNRHNTQLAKVCI